MKEGADSVTILHTVLSVKLQVPGLVEQGGKSCLRLSDLRNILVTLGRYNSQGVVVLLLHLLASDWLTANISQVMQPHAR